MSKLTALQRHFVTEEIEQDYDNFTVDGTDYLVLTIDEVNDRAYEYAKEHDFRFFSFGDAMFIKKDI